MKPAGFLFHWFSVVTVSAYMATCAAWLLLRGKLDRKPLRQFFRSLLHRRWRGPLGPAQPELGRCWTAPVPDWLCSDQDLGSRLVVLEDGVPLARPHSGHDDIRSGGAGRYSHWGNAVYFAPSDDSDPRSNGRRYTAEER